MKQPYRQYSREEKILYFSERVQFYADKLAKILHEVPQVKQPESFKGDEPTVQDWNETVRAELAEIRKSIELNNFEDEVIRSGLRKKE